MMADVPQGDSLLSWLSYDLARISHNAEGLARGAVVGVARSCSRSSLRRG